MDQIYDAEVLVMFKIKNAVGETEINDHTVDFNLSFNEAGVDIITNLIESEGLFGVVADDFDIIDIMLVPHES